MIYTKTGDAGTTALVDGTRVSKSDLKVEAYGTVDELNSCLGLLAQLVEDTAAGYFEELKKIQNELFVLQSLLAAGDDSVLEKLPKLPERAVSDLEASIDDMTSRLPENRQFVIPGGSVASAQAHVARTVCRRAERCCVRLKESVPVQKTVLPYLNRLSDYLFVLSRMILKLENRPEQFWQKY